MGSLNDPHLYLSGIVVDLLPPGAQCPPHLWVWLLEIHSCPGWHSSFYTRLGCMVPGTSFAWKIAVEQPYPIHLQSSADYTATYPLHPTVESLWASRGGGCLENGKQMPMINGSNKLWVVPNICPWSNFKNQITHLIQHLSPIHSHQSRHENYMIVLWALVKNLGKLL